MTPVFNGAGATRFSMYFVMSPMSVCPCWCNVYVPISRCGVVKHNHNYQGNICYTESGQKKRGREGRKEGRKEEEGKRNRKRDTLILCSIVNYDGVLSAEAGYYKDALVSVHVAPEARSGLLCPSCIVLSQRVIPQRPYRYRG